MADAENEEIDRETGEVRTRMPAPMVTAEISVVGAEIDQQIATARRYPRRSDKTISNEIMGRATLNDEIARECFYHLTRKASDGGSNDIIGPSIRLAEIVAASYGNIRVAARFVRIDDQDKNRVAVVVEAVAMDMQTNHAILKQVRRSIMTSPRNGVPRMFSADMVNVTIMAGQSIAQRDVVLQLVPKAIWIDGYHQARAVARGDEKTLITRRHIAMEAFGRIKITPAEIFAALGVENEQAIGLDQLEQLMGMWTAMKDGETKEAVFGRAIEERGAPGAPPRNPLADKPAQTTDANPPVGTDKAADIPAKQPAEPVAQKTQAVASNGTAKSDVATDPDLAKADQARGTPADAPADPGEAKPAREPAKRTGDAAPVAAGPLKGRDYVAAAIAHISEAKSAASLRDWWKRERGTGRRMAELVEADYAELEDSYQERLGAFEA